MRKLLFIAALCVTCLVFAEIPHKYYVGRVEVGEAFWHAIPDSVRSASASGKWDYDTLIIERLDLPFEYRLDSVGDLYSISRRSDAEIAAFQAQLSALKSSIGKDICKMRIGDSVPNFDVVKNPGGALVRHVLSPGKCYLLNFWATWCGNCLLELLPSEIPALAEKFIDEKDFIFLPICIDSSFEELAAFFESPKGERWEHLRYVTTLDINRTANSIFAEAGHLPLTVVVGTDGRVKYIHNGRISTPQQFQELEDAIVSGLSH